MAIAGLYDQNAADCSGKPAGCALGYWIWDIRGYPPVEPPDMPEEEQLN